MYLQSIKSVKYNAAKSVNRSILKKSRHIGFGVFIVSSSMGEMFRVSNNVKCCSVWMTGEEEGFYFLYNLTALHFPVLHTSSSLFTLLSNTKCGIHWVGSSWRGVLGESSGGMYFVFCRLYLFSTQPPRQGLRGTP
jgi:hypothetical protein